MRKIIGWLSPEDHERYVRSYARCVVAMGGNPGVDVSEAEEAIVADQRLFGELRKRYNIDADEVVDFSLYDGAIFEDDQRA